MAEKDLGFNTAVELAGDAVQDEQLSLKKRARRRLIGAIALALLAVIVLPMVMDQEPKPLTQDIQIRIPNQEPGTIASLSRNVPKPLPMPQPVPGKATEPAPAPAAPVSAGIPVAKPEASSSAPERNAEKERTTALLNGEQWVVQLGAYQDMANVRLLQGKIKELGYPSFTEKVETPQGTRVRVRAGPLASREAAEKAQERLKKISAGAPLGGVVAQK